ncbi:hypothetical protein [Desulfoglaeba alkanexedens]|uniref:Uncharacterized protein n=1 Tax=Desulfoglaeba alkanexedens ALDC TaxID=980445 RepID=A0A4P8L2L5_9BACT|nr:hypothetical protein [Desulfoglaeba alkanexedens]QCQ22060.1 hypothetical protein FDQ92_07655 [Desulfoglaeba alkanexedens ALDC]
MEDDLISCLTRQVKEEVLENYLTERRIIEIQTEDLEAKAAEVRRLADETGQRMARLGFLMLHPDMLGRCAELLRIPSPSFWRDCLEKQAFRGVRFIRVSALTDKGKFRKLVLESYRRLFAWMNDYRKAYEDLEIECRAVNHNIKSFHQNFDLLTILNFLKNLDVCAVEQKHFLGENFTPEEMASVEQKLHFQKQTLTRFGLPEPLSLPRPAAVEESLSALARDVYRRYQSQVKRIVR